MARVELSIRVQEPIRTDGDGDCVSLSRTMDNGNGFCHGLAFCEAARLLPVAEVVLAQAPYQILDAPAYLVDALEAYLGCNEDPPRGPTP